ncbi:CZB domain-containing protein [Hymenobacter ginkgonis]|nr:CZB domain-containing protein [Hymenobacter ginkgonis]
MSPEAIKQDFESALIRHLSFKARLRSFLHGNNNEEGPLRDPDQCSLGKWIVERRRGIYAHLPEMQELDQRHRAIHQQANRLMDLHLAGRRDEALAGFSSVQQAADHIVDLLQTAESKLRTLGREAK